MRNHSRVIQSTVRLCRENPVVTAAGGGSAGPSPPAAPGGARARRAAPPAGPARRRRDVTCAPAQPHISRSGAWSFRAGTSVHPGAAFWTGALFRAGMAFRVGAAFRAGPVAPAPRAARSVFGRPRRLLTARIRPRSKISPPQTPHGSRRSIAPGQARRPQRAGAAVRLGQLELLRIFREPEPGVPVPAGDRPCQLNGLPGQDDH